MSDQPDDDWIRVWRAFRAIDADNLEYMRRHFTMDQRVAKEIGRADIEEFCKQRIAIIEAIMEERNANRRT